MKGEKGKVLSQKSTKNNNNPDEDKTESDNEEDYEDSLHSSDELDS